MKRLKALLFNILSIVLATNLMAAGGEGDHAPFDPAAVATHHISDANTYTIMEAITIPLPVIVYNKERGLEVFMSSKFHPDPHHHEDGHYAYNGYVMRHGSVYRVDQQGFPMEGTIHLDHPEGFRARKEMVDGKEKEVVYTLYQGQEYKAVPRSTWDGGALGGGVTSFYDLSPSKNVIAMLLVCSLLLWLLIKAANGYAKNAGKAPRGIQNIFEPIILFIRDDVAIPFIGEKKYQKYFPFLLSVFFFILGLNLFGQVPFLGGVNATGNISITLVLALLVFLVVNINGNKHYWAHIFWMPGVPIPMKILLMFIEVMSLFIKPLTLMLRLAGNISAGHIAIISFIGLIFIFGESGKSILGGTIGSIISVPLTMFMMALELIVAFVQAFVFTILTASYIGAAIEDHHHEEAHH
ncbi:MAG TPA: F0F1 ATP synthase subunit A [Saprospiraceae bacterium]|nr:F0F1 ATP synthase subunit A [Saprospiraceae bacterium]